MKQKVDMGAEFIVTQMFFDNNKYIEFVKKCRENGIDVPIIPGLKPITSSKQLISLPKVFHIDLPEDLSEAIQSCKNETEVKDVGIEYVNTYLYMTEKKLCAKQMFAICGMETPLAARNSKITLSS